MENFKRIGRKWEQIKNNIYTLKIMKALRAAILGPNFAAPYKTRV